MNIFLKGRIGIFLIITLLSLITGILRVTNNTINPNGLNVDEVSFGYNAYSILQTGRDEYGRFMPLTFESYGDYKNPVPIYILVPFIAIFGLNDFSVRFINILAAMATIPVFYAFVYLLTKNKVVAITSIIFLTISPWHIYFSRFLHENILVFLFLVTGTTTFLKMIYSRKIIWPILSAFFFSISIYTYYSPRGFVPFLIILLILLNWRILLANKKTFLIWIGVIIIICTPMLIAMIFGNDSARAKMTYIGNDIELKRNILLEGKGGFFDQSIESGIYYFYLLFHWVRKYLNYFHPDFLFFQGLDMTTTGTFGSGVVYLFEAPLLLLGLFKVIKNSLPNRFFVIGWVMLGLIPASLTLSEQNHSRTMLILPMLLLLSSIGAVEIFKLLKAKLSNIVFKACFGIYSLFIFWNLVHIFFVFSIHFPNQRGEYFMEGTRESIQTVLQLQDQYTEIILDPKRGVTEPNIVSVPHMYYLFYSKYDPASYQKVLRDLGGDFRFGKVTIRGVDWRYDRSKENTLFVGSPWSFPKKDIKESQIIKKIYLKNGDLALMIVDPTK